MSFKIVSNKFDCSTVVLYYFPGDSQGVSQVTLGTVPGHTWYSPRSPGTVLVHGARFLSNAIMNGHDGIKNTLLEFNNLNKYIIM